MMHYLGLPTDFDNLDQDLVKVFGKATSSNEQVEFADVVDKNIVWETKNIKLNKCQIHNLRMNGKPEKYIVCILDFYYKPSLDKISLLDFK
jgi:hypothetical protein